MLKLLGLVCAAVLSLWGGPIQNDTQFQAAITAMGAEEKLVLMLYALEDCPECAYMKKKVFPDALVKPYLDRHFIIIEKNIHKDTLPDGYDFIGIPTMFFIDKAGNNKETIIGSKRIQPFLEELHRIRGVQ